MPCYFFAGTRYIRVTRGETGPGSTDGYWVNEYNSETYPNALSAWGWPAGFAPAGIDAALNSGPVDYFFSGNMYIRVTRGNTGPGTTDVGYPKPIGNWGWPAQFSLVGGKHGGGIDAALYSGAVSYFFAGNQYIRVTRGDTGPGTTDVGYPKPIANWGWPAGFAVGGARKNGIDAALYSGSVCYFFAGTQYIRVTRSDTGPGTTDVGYPKPLTDWTWPPDIRGNGQQFGLNGIDAALWSGTDSDLNPPHPPASVGSEPEVPGSGDVNPFIPNYP